MGVYQPRSFIAIWGIWLAWARTETPAWTRICERLIAEVSSATSTSRIRLLPADRFSAAVRMVLDTVLNRLPAAPRVERALATRSMAVSMVARAAWAVAAVDSDSAFTPRAL